MNNNTERITWSAGKWAEAGHAGGFLLFTVGYGSKRKDTMYYLETTLPVRSPSVIGQHYPTPTHAKVAAERLLSAFIDRVSLPAEEVAQ